MSRRGRPDTVFISYSHDDRDMADLIVGRLREVEATEGFETWIDDVITAGRAFTPDIERAIGRSRLAVLLLSLSFLESDYVCNVELPRLRERGVPLAPVLVEDCHWHDVEPLDTIAWTHDQRRDLPLRAMTASQRTAQVGAVADAVVAAFRAARREALSGVPPLRPGTVARPELDNLVATLIDGAPEVGLYGDPGVGKTVLATMVARHVDVGQHFGIVRWIAVGRDADLVERQEHLLDLLDHDEPHVSSVAHGRDLLRSVLRDQRALLVLDDVWTPEALFAFQVLGPEGGLLFTTREWKDKGALTRLERVGAFTPNQARELAAGILDVPADTLPKDADEALAAVGFNARRVEDLAGSVRGGRAWGEADLAGPLVGDATPDAAGFGVIERNLSTLPAPERDAFASLAVFPADRAIPLSVLATYWRRTPEETLALVHELDRARLVTLDRNAGTIGVHDDRLDYLQQRYGPLAARHREFLDAHRAALPDRHDGWWQLGDEPYLWDHLLHHLARAGDATGIHTTYSDPLFLVRRQHAAGLHAIDRDIRAAAEIQPDEWLGAVRTWVQDHAELLESLPDAGDVAATARLWLQVSPDLRATADRLDPLLPEVHLSLRWGLGRTPSALKGPVTAVASTPGRPTIACGGADGAALLNRRDGRLVCELPRRGAVLALAWAPDGTLLSTGGRRGLLLVRDGSEVVARDDATAVRALAFHPDGRTLATAGTDGVVSLRDPQTAAVGATSPERHYGWVEDVAFSPDGRLLATAAQDRDVLVRDARTLELRARLSCDEGDWMSSVRFAPDSDVVAAAGHGRWIGVWTSSGEPVRRLHGHGSRITALAFSPGGRYLVSGDAKGEFKLWDWRTGSCLCTQRLHRCTAIEWAAHGIIIATGGRVASFELRPRSGDVRDV